MVSLVSAKPDVCEKYLNKINFYENKISYIGSNGPLSTFIDKYGNYVNLFVVSDCLAPRCIDSDLGGDIYTPGYVLWNDYQYYDNCYNDLLSEYYCRDDGSYSRFPVTCIDGCVNGACV